MAIDKTKWKTIKKIDFDKLGQDTFDKHKAKMEKDWLDKVISTMPIMDGVNGGG